jgi:biopolymer transport protein TolR
MSVSIASRKGQSAEMNVTPLIDVLLVLIIIFMVVIPHHSHGEQADIPTPALDSRVPDPERTIVVQLLDEGEEKRPALKINEEQTSWEHLLPRMKEIMSLRADRVAFMQADGNVEFAYVAEVAAMTRAAGADRIGLMTVHPKPLRE